MPLYLSKREHIAVMVMGICLLVFFVFQFAVFPMVDENRRMTRVVKSKAKTLSEISVLSGEIHRIREQDVELKKRLADRSSKFNLFSFMDELAGQAGIKEWISTMKPSVLKRKNSSISISQVEMKIEGATLERIVPFLNMVETSPNAIAIPRMTITRTDESTPAVDVVILAEVSEVAEGEK